MKGENIDVDRCQGQSDDLKYASRLEKNKLKAKERLNGKEVDFKDLEQEEVERLKLELKKAKKREKQAIINKKKR